MKYNELGLSRVPVVPIILSRRKHIKEEFSCVYVS
jgi:hypothetical protein